METEGPKTHHLQCWVPIDEKCHHLNVYDKKNRFCTFTPTHKTPNPRTTSSHLSKQVFISILTERMVRSAEPLKNWPPNAWATTRSRPRLACRGRRRSGGCRGTAQSSFNHRVPQISLPWTFFVERAQDTARSVSSSCKTWRTASTFDPRAHNVESRWMFQKMGIALGP